MPYNENMPVSYGHESAPKKKKIVILDTSDALEREAFTAAEAKMTENKESLRGLKGIFKKIWKHNLFHEYYRQKEVFIARKKIEESGNVYVNENLGKEAHDSAMGSVMERFTSEYEEEMIHTGEEKKTISSDSQEGGELKVRVQELIQDYAKGNLSEEQFVLEKNAIFGQELEGIRGDTGEAIVQKGKMYADNLLEVAKQIRQSVEYGAKLEELDTEFDVIVGRARLGERTEAQFNRVDRWIEKIQKIKFIGSIANEATVAAAVSAVYALGTKVALGGARATSKILGPLGFGLSAGIGGAVAGARENKRLKEERAQHARERARGKTFEKGAERRAEMEQFQYETKSASGLAHDLETSLERLKADPQKTSLDLLFAKLNEVEGRITFSDRSNVDLIHYSDVKSIEKERTQLDVLRAEAKVHLRKLLAEKKAGKVEINLPFEDEAGFMDYLFLAREIQFEDGFSKERERKDRAFNKMKRVKVAKATAKGFAIGLGVGMAAQEVATIWNGTEGIFTPSSAHAADLSSGFSEPTPVPRYTSLEYVRRMFAGELHQNYGGPYAETIVGQNHFSLPKGFVLQQGPAGLNLMRGHDVMLSGLKLKPDGTLTDASLRILHDQGITADAVSLGVPGKEIIDLRTIGNSNYKLPQGFSFVKNPSGTYDLLGPKGPGGNVSVENLKLNPDGSLSQEAKDALTQRGVSWGNVTEHISDAKHQEYIFDPKEYVAKHSDRFHRISRLWYDNDTPKPKFDHNELRLRWGGPRGMGVENGKFVMDISHMTKDGSFHNGLSVDAQKLMAEGKLKMLFSLTRGTQNNVIEVPIDAHGHISIDPNSENGKLLFGMDAKGHAIFKGKFAEVAHSLGMKNGAEQVGILATHTGDGLGPIKDVIDIPAVDKTSTFLKVAEHSTKFMIPSDYEVDWPFVIPMAGRRPLEPIIHGPSPDQLIHVSGYSERLKRHYTEILAYRNSKEMVEKMLVQAKRDKQLSTKYKVLLDRFEELKNFSSLSDDRKEYYQKELDKANKRLHADNRVEYFNINSHVEREIQRIYQQIENIFIEESQVGEKPYSPEFYENSPLIRGIERAEEIVLILDYPLGDAILTVPILHVLKKYFEQNGFNKKIKVMTAQVGLFKSLENQFEGLVELISLDDASNFFNKQGMKERFIINAHKGFEEYGVFGLSSKEAADPSRVMSVDWASWMREEVPRSPKTGLKKFEMMPQRIMRNFEVILGQRIFDDIRKVDKFIEPSANFEIEKEALKKRYGVKNDEQVVVMSAGSSVTPKEYTPENWEKVISGLSSKFPKMHIIFLDDPSPEKRQKYGALTDNLKQSGINVTRASEGLGAMNALMGMADLVITPDTGLGHYASSMGIPNITFSLSDPVQWSTPKTKRISHDVAKVVYAQGKGSYSRAWGNPDEYYVEDDGRRVGASDIDPQRIIRRAEKILNQDRQS